MLALLGKTGVVRREQLAKVPNKPSPDTSLAGTANDNAEACIRSAPTKKPASRPAGASMLLRRPPQDAPHGSNMNTNDEAPGLTWPPGTSIAPRSLAVAKPPPGSHRLTGWRGREGRGTLPLTPPLFWIFDNGSSHRGQKADQRLQSRWPSIIPVHTPVHASWLNQIEIYFSIIQRKVLTPSDFPGLVDLETALLAFQHRYEKSAVPFRWTFTPADLAALMRRLKANPLPAAA